MEVGRWVRKFLVWMSAFTPPGSLFCEEEEDGEGEGEGEGGREGGVKIGNLSDGFVDSSVSLLSLVFCSVAFVC